MARQTPVDIVCSELASVGLAHEVLRGGKHAKVRWEDAEGKHQYVCSESPGDRRALLNCRSDIRRMLRAAGLA